ncbi:MAG: DUF1573 domain-containing protein [Chitinophagaceae bacterium]|nr:DUF1573 domain-containing protein [Chitinophagaceae bacterium]
MIRLFSLVTAFAMLLSCNPKDKSASAGNNPVAGLTEEQKQSAMADSANYTTIEWLDPTTLNLGKLVKDQNIDVVFRFKNSGNKNLIIKDVSAPCGCTIPEKPHKPFAPGEEGEIRAKFNGSGHGTITKQIHVKANTKPVTDHTLTFTGEIQDKK